MYGSVFMETSSGKRALEAAFLSTEMISSFLHITRGDKSRMSLSCNEHALRLDISAAKETSVRSHPSR